MKPRPVPGSHLGACWRHKARLRGLESGGMPWPEMLPEFLPEFLPILPELFVVGRWLLVGALKLGAGGRREVSREIGVLPEMLPEMLPERCRNVAGRSNPGRILVFCQPSGIAAVAGDTCE